MTVVMIAVMTVAGLIREDTAITGSIVERRLGAIAVHGSSGSIITAAVAAMSATFAFIIKPKTI